ncbi:MAG: hypothetical protein Q4D02_06775 [Clostridia bacterium]|nr:hypothetical protein [Clostridia bacterium]
MNHNLKKKIGSGILVVILSAIVFSIYVSSAYSESEHFYLLEMKYEKSIVELYEKDYNNINEYYERVLESNKE